MGCGSELSPNYRPRITMAHYNTLAEVERLVGALDGLNFSIHQNGAM